jgi:hypothetical protein
MRNRFLMAALVTLIALSATAATIPPAFVGDVVHRDGMLPYLRVSASPDLTLIQEVELAVVCYDANLEKIGEYNVRLSRRDPDVRKPWVSVLRFPEKMAKRIEHVTFRPLSAKMAPPGGIALATGCFSFCRAASFDCNEFCALQSPPSGGTVSVFTCGGDGGGCSAYCRCDNGAEAYY